MAKKAAAKATKPAKPNGKPAPKPQRRTGKIARLRLDGGAQMRARLNADQVQALRDVLAEAPEEGQAPAELDPIDVFEDEGGELWPGDGFHRIEAYTLEGRTTIPMLVHKGTRRDAQIYALSANARSVLPRTNEDKRKAVMFALSDPELSQWTSRTIARKCAVSHVFVEKMRGSSSASVDTVSMETVSIDTVSTEATDKRKFIDKDGKESERSATNTRRTEPANDKPPSKPTPAPSVGEFTQGEAEANWICKKDGCDWTNPPDAEQCILCGHKRPAPKKAAAKPEANGKHEPEAPPEPPRDLVGNVVPEALREEWAAHQDLYGKVNSLFNQLTDTINRLANSPLGVCLASRLSRRGAAGKDFWRSTHLENARADVTFERPHSSLCPYCVGEGKKKPSKDCKVCEGRGWVPRFAWDGAPPEYRALVERTAQVAGEGGGA